MREALRANRKTVTRRRIAAGFGIQEQPAHYRFLGMDKGSALFEVGEPGAAPHPARIPCPFGPPGSLLRVTEEPDLVLEITEVRAEPVQAITEAEAWAEGVDLCLRESTPGTGPATGCGAPPRHPDSLPAGSAVAAFRALITAIYPTAWARNEWVWVIRFRRR
ncbi:hypothetical protein E5K00_04210 [Hymenobacter aquaticus]|uniref:ASCH domain-containing protein n=1 Tax=Hymenobacter aquaticus TaxID=1867101 RepID=A0A4Z0Q310_9BACT|nr:hypothetical protein [Hymenobacter aquaticus]TGE24427.1 hypothetical protein E5K00_04210 [Hymenobacter aquaticus]